MKWTAAVLVGLMTADWCAMTEPLLADQKPVYTNQQRFGIPFQFDAAELSRLGTREVRLYVSVDRGGTWLLVQSVSPSTRRFHVRAPQDGEYWFSVRTLSRTNQEHPSGDRFDPELKVVVDTASPKLQIKLSQPEAGKLRLDWTATDKALDVSTLRLESMQSGRTTWRKVYISKQVRGSTVWKVPQGGAVEVRGRISDFAGNISLAHDSVRIAAASQSVPRQPVPDFNEPIASKTRKSARRTLPAQFPGVPGNGSGERRGSASRTPRADQPSLEPLPRTAQKPLPLLSTQESSGDLGPVQSIRRLSPQSNGNNSTPSFNTTFHRPQKTASSTPTQIVNRWEFEINYRVGKVGTSGVRSVELYITLDDGQKWYRYGSDPDRSSPFAVVVPKDGVYGFAIRVRSGAGLAAPPPQPSEKPAIKIIVDKTPPSLQLLPILQGTGSNVNRFKIRWKSADANPSDRPISIAYSANPNGPWRTISGRLNSIAHSANPNEPRRTISDWIANKGNHLWTVNANVPPHVYIQLTARDRAGNLSSVRTSRPVIVDLVKPSAEIIGVNRSKNGSPRR